jgi:DNA-binding beta-propeller fold protein YncE
VKLIAVCLCLLSTVPSPVASADYDPTTLVYPPFGHCLGMHRITDFHRFVYLGMRTKIDNPTGIAAVKLLSEDDPSTTVDDDELTVFGLNTGRCEILYNVSLYEARIFGECGSGQGQFREPLGIAADERGNVFVADTGNDRVVQLRYGPDGLRWVRAFVTPGTWESPFRKPSQVALGESGTLYVADTDNDRVIVMSQAGEPILEIRGDSEAGVTLDGPTGLAVVEHGDLWIASGRDDVLVVADRGGTRLLKFATDGTLEALVEAAALPLSGSRFGSLAIDFYGNTYATDGSNGCIHKLDWQLHHVASVGRHGTGNKEFDDPRGITLWRRFGQIFVTERTGAQYLWIGTEIQDFRAAPPTVTPGAEPLSISYRLTETARVTIELIDGDGRAVHSLVENRRRALGANRERWNGLSMRDGEPVKPGAYTLRITAAPTYSSGVYFHDTAETALQVLAAGAE